MPSNQTPNYGLSQWEKTDQVLMEDFNADNSKIDEALEAGADARAALLELVGQKADQSALTEEAAARTSAVNTINAALAKKGNCEISVSSYTGNGNSGSSAPCRVTFPKVPLFAMVYGVYRSNLLFLPTEGNLASFVTNNSYQVNISWSGSTATWYSEVGPAPQMNETGIKYLVFAFYKAD